MFDEINMKNVFKSEYQKKIAIIDSYGNQITYQELSLYGNIVTNYIKERSIVLILCKNTWQEISVYASCINRSIIPLLLPLKLGRNQICEIIKKYQIKYLYASEDIEYDFLCFKTYFNSHSYTLYFNDEQEVEFGMDENLALLMTTSGTMGSCKVVRISYENLEENTKSIIQYLALDMNEKAILTMPISYVYTLSIINTHLYVGATILLSEHNIYDIRFWGFLDSNKATSFSGVPYTYEIINRLGILNKNINSLTYFTQAGGKISDDLLLKYMKYCKRFNKRFIVMYGQTEATARMSYMPWNMLEHKIGSIGKAIPGGELWLEDGEGIRILSHNVKGELVYKGKNVAMGYSDSYKDLKKGDEWNGILHTGDIAKYDEDGYYYICGRIKRISKIFGFRINLDELEQRISNKLNCEVVCLDKGDKINIVIQSSHIADENIKSVVEENGLDMHNILITYIDKFTYSINGKIDYSQIIKRQEKRV